MSWKKSYRGESKGGFNRNLRDTPNYIKHLPLLYKSTYDIKLSRHSEPRCEINGLTIYSSIKTSEATFVNAIDRIAQRL